MKKINAILSNSTKEQYPVLINKLSDIIEPFALHIVWAFERGDYYFL